MLVPETTFNKVKKTAKRHYLRLISDIYGAHVPRGTLIPSGVRMTLNMPIDIQRVCQNKKRPAHCAGLFLVLQGSLMKHRSCKSRLAGDALKCAVVNRCLPAIIGDHRQQAGSYRD
jgi:hypothetical protein